MTHATTYIKAGDFLLRTMMSVDITPDFVCWFNCDYVVDGLNLARKKFTREHHCAHILSVATGDSELLIIQEIGGPLVNSYFKVDIDSRRGIATFSIAIDRDYAKRRRCISEVVWHAARHFINARHIHKVTILINKSNVAARSYMSGSEFKLEGVLRGEAIYDDGRRDDVLVYAVLPEDLRDRWGKVSPFAHL